jgi:hypothetical protein
LSGPTSIVPAPRLQIAATQVDAAATAVNVDAAEPQDASAANDAPAVAGTLHPEAAPPATRERPKPAAPRSVAGPRAPPRHS